MTKKNNGLGKFIGGIALGVGLGVLFAPASGKETRRQLKNKVEEAANYIKNIDKNEVKRELTKKINEIKKELKSLDKEKVMEIAKEQANNIVTKADELIKLAKEKAEPVVLKAAEEIRSKAVAVLKDATAKLEGTEKPSKTKKITK